MSLTITPVKADGTTAATSHPIITDGQTTSDVKYKVSASGNVNTAPANSITYNLTGRDADKFTVTYTVATNDAFQVATLSLSGTTANQDSQIAYDLNLIATYSPSGGGNETQTEAITIYVDKTPPVPTTVTNALTGGTETPIPELDITTPALYPLVQTNSIDVSNITAAVVDGTGSAANYTVSVVRSSDKRLDGTRSNAGDETTRGEVALNCLQIKRNTGMDTDGGNTTSETLAVTLTYTGDTSSTSANSYMNNTNKTYTTAQFTVTVTFVDSPIEVISSALSADKDLFKINLDQDANWYSRASFSFSDTTNGAANKAKVIQGGTSVAAVAVGAAGSADVSDGASANVLARKYNGLWTNADIGTVVPDKMAADGTEMIDVQLAHKTMVNITGTDAANFSAFTSFTPNATTTTSAASASGDSTITLTAVTNFAAGDVITIGGSLIATISSIDTNTKVVTLTAALSGAVANGATVVTNTSGTFANAVTAFDEAANAGAGNKAAATRAERLYIKFTPATAVDYATKRSYDAVLNLYGSGTFGAGSDQADTRTIPIKVIVTSDDTVPVIDGLKDVVANGAYQTGNDLTTVQTAGITVDEVASGSFTEVARLKMDTTKHGTNDPVKDVTYFYKLAAANGDATGSETQIGHNTSVVTLPTSGNGYDNKTALSMRFTALDTNVAGTVDLSTTANGVSSAGQTTLALTSATGLAQNDVLLIGTSTEVTVDAVNGNNVTLTANLESDVADTTAVKLIGNKVLKIEVTNTAFKRNMTSSTLATGDNSVMFHVFAKDPTNPGGSTTNGDPASGGQNSSASVKVRFNIRNTKAQRYIGVSTDSTKTAAVVTNGVVSFDGTTNATLVEYTFITDLTPETSGTYSWLTNGTKTNTGTTVVTTTSQAQNAGDTTVTVAAAGTLAAADKITIGGSVNATIQSVDGNVLTLTAGLSDAVANGAAVVEDTINISLIDASGSSTASQAQNAGDTTITVADISTFPSSGTILIGGTETATISSVDTNTKTITLTAGLTNAVANGASVVTNTDKKALIDSIVVSTVVHPDVSERPVDTSLKSQQIKFNVNNTEASGKTYKLTMPAIAPQTAAYQNKAANLANTTSFYKNDTPDLSSFFQYTFNTTVQGIQFNGADAITWARGYQYTEMYYKSDVTIAETNTSNFGAKHSGTAGNVMSYYNAVDPTAPDGTVGYFTWTVTNSAGGMISRTRKVTIKGGTTNTGVTDGKTPRGPPVMTTDTTGTIEFAGYNGTATQPAAKVIGDLDKTHTESDEGQSTANVSYNATTTTSAGAALTLTRQTTFTSTELQTLWVYSAAGQVTGNATIAEFYNVSNEDVYAYNFAANTSTVSEKAGTISGDGHTSLEQNASFTSKSGRSSSTRTATENGNTKQWYEITAYLGDIRGKHTYTMTEPAGFAIEVDIPNLDIDDTLATQFTLIATTLATFNESNQAFVNYGTVNVTMSKILFNDVFLYLPEGHADDNANGVGGLDSTHSNFAQLPTDKTLRSESITIKQVYTNWPKLLHNATTELKDIDASNYKTIDTYFASDLPATSNKIKDIILDNWAFEIFGVKNMGDIFSTTTAFTTEINDYLTSPTGAIQAPGANPSTFDEAIRKALNDDASYTTSATDTQANINAKSGQFLLYALRNKLDTAANQNARYRLTNQRGGLFHSTNKIPAGQTNAGYYPLNFQAGDKITVGVNFKHDDINMGSFFDGGGNKALKDKPFKFVITLT